MGAVKMIDREIKQYLPHLNIKQKQAVLNVIKTFAQEETLWNDKEYIAEMDRRFANMENGKTKGYTLEEMETHARQSYKNRKRKK